MAFRRTGRTLGTFVTQTNNGPEVVPGGLTQSVVVSFIHWQSSEIMNLIYMVNRCNWIEHMSSSSRLWSLRNFITFIKSWVALGCPKINFSTWIEPLLLYGMCIGHTRSHAKFQTSGLNDLTLPPLFVKGSWPSRKSFKMICKLSSWPCHLEENRITLGVLDFRK